ITAIVYLPTLRYYFGGDDFVVLGDIQYRGNAWFIIDTLRMHDVVPNWRPLTGAVYLLEWRAFGLHPMAWRLVNLGVHLSSLVLLYALVVRVTKRPAVGAASALIFGISGAHFDTVTYITALPHVLAMFFVLASLLAMVTYADDNERDLRAFALSFVAFALAFLANEGSFVFAPLVVLAYIVFSRRWQKAPLRLVLHALPFAAIAVGWLSFYESCTCPQLKFDRYAWGPHVFSNYAVYFSFIAYPAHGIPHHPDVLRWVIAGTFAAVGLLLLARGPKLAKIAVPGILLALLPFVPVEIWTASRYTYAAVAFFAPLAALLAYAVYERLHDLHPRLRVPVNMLALLFVATVGSLYGWQTHARDHRSGQEAERWQLLVNELRGNYASVPPGTTIYIIDGPWTNPMEQYLWVPSVARALYGNAAAFDYPAASYAAGDPQPPGERSVYLRWTASGLHPVPEEQVFAAP
ncbi:MAG: ArnT family glycosyltransferase, partial [Gemmatimonadaceae bacterium]